MTKFPYHLVDLTHTLDEDIPSWDGGCGFQHKTTLDYADCSSDVKFRVQQFNMYAGIGTHMDAPAHCIPGAITIDQLVLTNLIVPGIVIDVSKSMHERYSVTPHDIEQFENKYGPVPAGSLVMFRTGWGKFWHQPEQYINNHVFPSVSRDTALLLLDRNVCGLGIDTLSPDRPEDGYIVHQLLLGNGKYLIENAANLQNLPASGSFIAVLPIKVKGATEAPIRLIGLVNC